MKKRTYINEKGEKKDSGLGPIDGVQEVPEKE